MTAPRGRAKTNAAKVRCHRGHPFTPRNTYRWCDSDGFWHRQCRACNVIRTRRSRRNRKNKRGVTDER